MQHGFHHGFVAVHGIRREEGYAAVDRMRPELIKLINRYRSAEDILTALGRAFYQTLERAGHTCDRQIMFFGEHVNPSRNAHEAAKRFTKLTEGLITEGFDEIAIAWGYCGAILNVARASECFAPDELGSLGENLSRIIKTASDNRGYLLTATH